MPKNLQKSLQSYLSKIKKQTPNFYYYFCHHSPSFITNKLLLAYKYPKNLLFFVNQKDKKDQNDDCHQNNRAATLEDIDRFLIENFKSLYGQKHDHGNDNELTYNMEKETRHENHEESTPYGTPREALVNSPRFFTSTFDNSGSNRFFISPGSSSSSVDNETNHCEVMAKAGGDCIAILTKSPNPYDDFRKSMQEMIEIRAHHGQSVDWDFMEELLLCYLKLNEKKQHRYILGAFADLIVVLRQNSYNIWYERSCNLVEEIISTNEGEK